MTQAKRHSILIVGPTPPPFHGVAVATNLLLTSDRLARTFDIVALDTADRRGIGNINRLDIVNIFLALKHGLQFLYLLCVKRPHLVYVPISQAALAFLRDCLFLVPARILRRKIVLHLHGSSFGLFYASAWPTTRLLIRLALRGASLAVVLGENLRENFDGLLLGTRVRVVPNGIPDIFHGTGDAPSAHPARRVLFMSSLRREKGLFDLIRALPLVPERARSMTFTFAGEWASARERSEALLLVKQLGLESVVDFTGPVGPEAKERLLRRSDVFVLPSLSEGQPLVILEAMCASLPVIATTAGAIGDLVINGRTGFIVAKNSPAEIASKLSILLADDALRVRMGRAGRRRMLEGFTVDQFIGNMIAVFKEALGETAAYTPDLATQNQAEPPATATVGSS